ncbi:MAG: hypothetical protein ACYDCC_16365 [Actinomycetota bacterium]
MKFNSLRKMVAALVMTAAFVSPSAHAASLEVPAGCIATSAGGCSFIASTTGSLEVLAAAGSWIITIGQTTCFNSAFASVYMGYMCNANAGQIVTLSIGANGGGIVAAESAVNVPGAPGQ